LKTLQPIQYRHKGYNYQIVFLLSHSLCDHSADQKLNANKSGGYYRCAKCCARFDAKDPSIFSYVSMSHVLRKNYENLKIAYGPTPNPLKTELQSAGQKFLPPIFLGDVSTPLQQLGIADLYGTAGRSNVDVLHDSKGVAYSLLNAEFSFPKFNKSDFLKLLNQDFHRNSLKTLRGSDLRGIIVQATIYLFPFMPKDRLLKAKPFYLALAEVLFIGYSKIHLQKNRFIQIRLVARCFQLQTLFLSMFEDLWGTSTTSFLYFHSMFTHWPEQFLYESFTVTSTENGEKWFAVIKNLLRAFTNRKPADALLEIQTRLYFHRLQQLQKIQKARTQPRSQWQAKVSLTQLFCGDCIISKNGWFDAEFVALVSSLRVTFEEGIHFTQHDDCIRFPSTEFHKLFAL
jgi:hypothetical protein